MICLSSNTLSSRSIHRPKIFRLRKSLATINTSLSNRKISVNRLRLGSLAGLNCDAHMIASVSSMDTLIIA